MQQQFAAEKILDAGGKVITLSDSSGYIYDERGIDIEKLKFVKRLKNVKRGRIVQYCDTYPQAVYTSGDPSEEYNPLWNNKADCAFPCATENEINDKDTQHLVKRPLKNVQFCSSSRKAKILTTGIH